VDLDWNGNPDAIPVDTDGDGVDDALAIDTNGDNFPDTLVRDLDRDGVFESVVEIAEPSPPPVPQPCSLQFSVETTSVNGQYAPRNAGALWVSSGSDAFIRTFNVWAERRVEHVHQWVAQSGQNRVGESEEKYRHLVETMRGGLAMYDVEDRFTYVNDRFCELLGYTREDIIGIHSFDFVDEAHKDKIRKHLEERQAG
jgi:PAS domain-containing protein